MTCTVLVYYAFARNNVVQSGSLRVPSLLEAWTANESYDTLLGKIRTRVFFMVSTLFNSSRICNSTISATLNIKEGAKGITI
jgi:hypothetical protein